uniref:Uncharacterized protein n=1 Tax=viral metagenome TaxID=1070528 RepID=A0A6M3LDI1_9ZZZZ
MLNVTPRDDLSTWIERGNFRHAFVDPSVDQTELCQLVSRFERRRRLQLTLAAMPEPTAADIQVAVLVTLARA